MSTLAAMIAARDALAPFAAAADKYDPPENDDEHLAWALSQITIGDFRRARAEIAALSAAIDAAEHAEPVDADAPLTAQEQEWVDDWIAQSWEKHKAAAPRDWPHEKEWGGPIRSCSERTAAASTGGVWTGQKYSGWSEIEPSETPSPRVSPKS